MTIRPHKNLVVWQEAILLVKEIYSICIKIREDEKYGLISQLKRAAISVPTNIAEGAARNTKKEFYQFLHIAKGSLSEIDTLLTIALELNYLKSDDLKNIFNKIEKTAALLNGLIKSLRQ